jgi:hypothetical protein
MVPKIEIVGRVQTSMDDKAAVLAAHLGFLPKKRQGLFFFSGPNGSRGAPGSIPKDYFHLALAPRSNLPSQRLPAFLGRDEFDPPAPELPLDLL